MTNLNLLATKIIRDDNKVNIETLSCYMKMKRINKKDFELLYFDSIRTCILKDKSTNQKIKYFNRLVDSFQYFEMKKVDIRNCNQLTGVNISGFENPFTECFYHVRHVNNYSQLIDIGNSYYFEMKSYYSGFEKKIWINKKTLLVDSIQYNAGATIKKIHYKYIDIIYKNDNHLENYQLCYDSLVQLLKKTTVKYPIPDSVRIRNELNRINKLTLLDFWFIGCKPCVASFPKIQALRDTFSTDNLSIRAIDYIDLEKNILHFKSKYNYQFDFEKDTSNLTTYFKVDVFPTLILLDSNGAIVLRIEGNKPQEYENLVNEIKKRVN